MKIIDEKYDIPYGNVYEKFHTHIELENNENILFSGRYGIGKSTFLNSYFSERSEDTFTIRISPVNYVVNSNENIFELIKADIIKQLYFNQKFNFSDNYELSKLDSTAYYALQNPIELGKHLSKALSKLHPIGEVLSGSFEAVHDLLSALNDFEKEINNIIKPDEQQLLEYLETKSIEPGSYLEFNIISELIFNIISNIKEEKNHVVLIIDDLDRLDPEHIFRILNIFSSHHDLDTNQNKFGFTKVILVCDLDNIEKTYIHRYGKGVDFEGYIDKFYSNEIFTFGNEDAILEYINSELSGQFDEGQLFTIKTILNQLVKNKELKVRQLVKYKSHTPHNEFIIDKIPNKRLKNTNITPENYPIHIDYNIGEVFIYSNSYKIYDILLFFCKLFGSINEVQKKFMTIERKNINFSDSNEIHSLINTLALFNLKRRYNRKYPEHLFIKNLEADDYGRIVQYDQDYPETQLSGLNCYIKPIWIAGNKYDAKSCFYKDYEVFISNQNTKNIFFQFKDVMENLLIALNELSASSDLRTKIGISS